MLRLDQPTDERWVARALANIPEILLDHAHCEKKAASTALNLVFRYPEHPSLVVPLTRLAREELSHFEEVLGVLQEHGILFRRQRPSPYAGKLMAIVRNSEPHRLLDTLLCCAFIEARSCERMKLLAGSLTDPRLAALYMELFVSEARHHTLFVDLALGIFDRELVNERCAEISQHESLVILDAPMEPRLHN